MTLEEAIEKYGDVPLTFDNYYKYTFSFTGEAEDGAKIVCTEGGDKDSVYRYSVDRDSERFLDKWKQSIIIRKDGETIFEHSRW